MSDILKTAKQAYHATMEAWEKVAREPDSPEKEAAKKSFQEAGENYLAAMKIVITETDAKWQQLNVDLDNATTDLNNTLEVFNNTAQVTLLMADIAKLLGKIIAM